MFDPILFPFMEGVHQLMPPFLTGEKGYRTLSQRFHAQRFQHLAVCVSVTLYLLTHLYEISCFLYFHPGNLSLLSIKVLIPFLKNPFSVSPSPAMHQTTYLTLNSLIKTMLCVPHNCSCKISPFLYLSILQLSDFS